MGFLDFRTNGWRRDSSISAPRETINLATMNRTPTVCHARGGKPDNWSLSIVQQVCCRVAGRSACLENFTTLATRSEEHTSELQSLMRISYAVFCLKKKNIHTSKISITNDNRALK